MGWTVDDIAANVADLRRRGLEFEQVEMPGITVTGGIAEIPGSYPKQGPGRVRRLVQKGRGGARSRPGRWSL